MVTEQMSVTAETGLMNLSPESRLPDFSNCCVALTQTGTNKPVHTPLIFF